MTNSRFSDKMSTITDCDHAGMEQPVIYFEGNAHEEMRSIFESVSAKFIKVGEYNNGKKENCSRQLEDEYDLQARLLN